MSRNSYLQIARLSSHPAFCMFHCGSLHCPFCDAVFTRVGEWDRHYIAHNPTREQAYEQMSGRSFERLAARRRWPA